MTAKKAPAKKAAPKKAAPKKAATHHVAVHASTPNHKIEALANSWVGGSFLNQNDCAQQLRDLLEGSNG